MTLTPTMMLAVAATLLCGGVLMGLGGGSSQKRLRERVVSTRDLRNSKTDDPQSLLLDREERRPYIARVLDALGYQRDIPKQFNVSLRVALPLAAVVGLVAFNLARLMLPAAGAVGIGLFIGLVTARVLFRRKAKSYRNLLFRQIPDTMSLMLRAVRAGLPVAEAVRSVGRESVAPTREEFGRVGGEIALGMPLEVAIRRLYERTRIQEYAFFSVVIALHSQTGGNLSETLENLADMVRRRVAMVAKARALSAEGRMSAMVVGALPFVVGFLVSLVNPGYMAEFINNPHGPFLIGTFAVLLSLGLLITHWMIQRSIQD